MSESYMRRDIADHHTGWKGGTQRMGGKGSKKSSWNSLMLLVLIAWLRQTAAEPKPQRNDTDLQVKSRAHNNYPLQVELIAEEEVYYPDIDQLVLSEISLPCQIAGDLLALRHPEFGCMVCGCFHTQFMGYNEFDTQFMGNNEFDVRCVSTSVCSLEPEPAPPVPSCAPYEPNKPYANPEDKCQICTCAINVDQQGLHRKNVNCQRNQECDCAPFHVNVHFAHPTDECQTCVCLNIIGAQGFPQRQIECKRNPACDIPSTTLQYTTTTPPTTTPYRVEPDATTRLPMKIGCDPFPENEWFPRPDDECQLCICQVVRNYLGQEVAEYSCRQNPKCEKPPLKPSIECDPFPENQWYQRPDDLCQMCICYKDNNQDGIPPHTECKLNPECTGTPVASTPVPEADCSPFPENEWFPHPSEHCHLCMCQKGIDNDGNTALQTLCKINPQCEKKDEKVCSPFPENEWFPRPGNACERCICQTSLGALGQLIPEYHCHRDPECAISTTPPAIVIPSTQSPETDCRPYPEKEWFPHPIDNCRICMCHAELDQAGHAVIKTECRLIPACRPTTKPAPVVPTVLTNILSTPTPTTPPRETTESTTSTPAPTTPLAPVCSPFPEEAWFPRPGGSCELCICQRSVDLFGKQTAVFSCRPNPECATTTEMPPPESTTVVSVCSPFPESVWFQRPGEDCELCICEVAADQFGKPKAEHLCKRNPQCGLSTPIPESSTISPPLSVCIPFPENKWFPRPGNECELCICRVSMDQLAKSVAVYSCRSTPECDIPTTPIPVPEQDCTPFPEDEWFLHPTDRCKQCVCHKGKDQDENPIVKTQCIVDPICIQPSPSPVPTTPSETAKPPEPITTPPVPVGPVTICSPFPENIWFLRPGSPCELCICYNRFAVDGSGELQEEFACRPNPECVTEKPETEATPTISPEQFCQPHPVNVWFPRIEDPCEVCICQVVINKLGLLVPEHSCRRNPQCDFNTTPAPPISTKPPSCSPFPEDEWFPRPDAECELCICQIVDDQFGQRVAEYQCRENPQCRKPFVPEYDCDPFPENQWYEDPKDQCQVCICHYDNNKKELPPRHECKTNPQCIIPPATSPRPEADCSPFPENEWFPHPSDVCRLCVCHKSTGEKGHPMLRTVCRINPECKESTTSTLPTVPPLPSDCGQYEENQWFLDPDNRCTICICRMVIDKIGQKVAEYSCRENPVCNTKPVISSTTRQPAKEDCSPFPENEWFPRPNNPCELCLCHRIIDDSDELTTQYMCRPNPRCQGEPTNCAVEGDIFLLDCQVCICKLNAYGQVYPECQGLACEDIETPTSRPPVVGQDCKPFQVGQWFANPTNFCEQCICRKTFDKSGKEVFEVVCMMKPDCATITSTIIPAQTSRPSTGILPVQTSEPPSSKELDCGQYGVNKWFQHPTSFCEVCVCEIQKDVLGLNMTVFKCRSKPECDCSPYKLNEWYTHAEDKCLFCICRPVTTSTGLQQAVTQCIHNPYCVSPVPILPPQPPDNVPTCAPFPTNIWFENPFDKCSVCLCYHQIGKPSVSSYCRLNNDCAVTPEALVTCDPMPVNEWVPRPEDACQVCICTFILNAAGVPEKRNHCMANPACGNTSITIPDCSPYPVNEWHQEPTDPCKLCICYPVTKPNGQVMVESNCATNPECAPVNSEIPDFIPPIHPPSKSCYPFPVDQYFPSPSDHCVECICRVVRDQLTNQHKANIECQHLQQCSKPLKPPVPTPGHVDPSIVPLTSAPTCEPYSPYVWFKNPLDPCESCICFHAVNAVGQPMVKYNCESNGECAPETIGPDKKKHSCKYEGDIYVTNCQVCICRIMENGELYPFCQGSVCQGDKPLDSTILSTEATPAVVLPTCEPYPINKWFPNPEDKCGFCICYYDSLSSVVSVKTMCVTKHCVPDILNPAVPDLDDCSPFPLNEWYINPSASCEICICRPDAENSVAGQLRMMTYCTRNPQCDSSAGIQAGTAVIASLPNAMDCSPFMPNQNFKPPNNPCEICTCKFEAGAMNVVCHANPQCGSNVVISDCRPNQPNQWYPHPAEPCVLCICHVIRNARGKLSRTMDCKRLMQCSSNNNSPALPEPPAPSCHPFPSNEWFQDMEDECKACICIHVINKNGVPRIQLRCRPNPSCSSNSTVQPLPTCSPLPMNTWFEHPDRYCDMCICYFADNGRGEPTIQTFCTPSPGCGQANGKSEIQLPSCSPFPMNEWYTHPSEYCKICICQIKGDSMGQPNAVTRCSKNPECDKDTDTKISRKVSPAPQSICFPVREDEWFHRDSDMCIACICRKGFEISGRPKAVVECIRNPQCVTPSWVPYPIWAPTQMNDCKPFPTNQWFPHITEVCIMCICRPQVHGEEMYAQMDCVPIPQCGQQNTSGVILPVHLPPADTSCHPYPLNQYFQYPDKPCQVCICRQEPGQSGRLTTALKCDQLSQCTDIANINVDSIINIIVPIDHPKIDVISQFDKPTIVDAICQSYPLDQVFQHPNESCINCYCAKQAAQVVSICVPDPICNGAIPTAIPPPALPVSRLEIVDVICYGYKQEEKFIHPNDVCRQCHCTVVNENKLIAKCRYHELCNYPVTESTTPDYIEPICKHYGLKKIFPHPEDPCYTCQCVIAFNHVLTNCEPSPDCERPLQPPPGPVGPPQTDFPDGSDTEIFFLEPNCRYRQLNQFYANPGKKCQICQCRMLYNIVFVTCKTMSSCNDISSDVVEIPFIDPICKHHPHGSPFQHPFRNCLQCSCQESELGTAVHCQETPRCNAEENGLIKFIDAECKNHPPGASFNHPTKNCQQCSCQIIYNMVQMVCKDTPDCDLSSTAIPDAPKKKPKCKYEGDIYHWNCQACFCRTTEKGDLYSVCQGTPCGNDELIFD